MNIGNLFKTVAMSPLVARGRKALQALKSAAPAADDALVRAAELLRTNRTARLASGGVIGSIGVSEAVGLVTGKSMFERIGAGVSSFLGGDDEEHAEPSHAYAPASLDVASVFAQASAGTAQLALNVVINDVTGGRSQQAPNAVAYGTGTAVILLVASGQSAATGRDITQLLRSAAAELRYGDEFAEALSVTGSFAPGYTPSVGAVLPANAPDARVFARSASGSAMTIDPADAAQLSAVIEALAVNTAQVADEAQSGGFAGPTVDESLFVRVMLAHGVDPLAAMMRAATLQVGLAECTTAMQRVRLVGRVCSPEVLPDVTAAWTIATDLAVRGFRPSQMALLARELNSDQPGRVVGSVATRVREYGL